MTVRHWIIASYNSINNKINLCTVFANENDVRDVLLEMINKEIEKYKATKRYKNPEISYSEIDEMEEDEEGVIHAYIDFPYKENVEFFAYKQEDLKEYERN